jgi:streptogrisin C
MSDEDPGDFPAYAELHGISVDEARHNASFIDEARSLQDALEANYAGEFAGLWVEHEPRFTVIVAMTGNRDGAIREFATSALKPYLETRTYRHSLAELQAIGDSLPLKLENHSIGIDVKTNQVYVTVLASDMDRAVTEVHAEIASGSVRTNETNALPKPIADSYGGLNLDLGACGEFQGTSGWSVVQDGTAVHGVVTAGHLSNCLKLNNVILTFQSEWLTGISDSQWHTTPGLVEQPWFKWHENNPVRVVDAKRSWANVVIGETVCKYGRTEGYECGEVTSKTVDPDGLLKPLSSKWIEISACDQADDLVDLGDSGGPAFFANTAYGIMTHDSGDIFCDNKGLFNSVTQVQNALGVTLLLDT